MAKLTEKYDVVNYLASPEDIALYLDAIMEEGDSQLLLSALGDVVRATRNISQFSRDTGLSRETLYHSLSKEGNPKYSSLQSILGSLGLGLSVKSIR
ncbi:MAG: putative addiction module antidote protein [Thiotrichales bacterium]|jgi:probable addiction module antidote protein|nr:putative addiction module antidote protein [Thiotrichales bacterium]MBT5291374.1 putative addiction module antidote protein [Thiotrichales bacterium]MBT7314688.1 putative addiction module antidote protein [Thiotrichales bacterium]